MISNWETNRGDEWWYSDNFWEAEGWFSSAYPVHLEISLKDTGNKYTEKALYDFLLTTQKKFPDCQLWLCLNQNLKKIVTELKEMNYGVASPHHA